MIFSNAAALTIPEGGVTKIMAGNLVLWEQPQTGNIPKEYREVEWIRADKNVGAYLDLGFAFDMSAEIYIEQFLDNEPQWLASNENTYIFGAANSTGVYRCMLTSPENNFGSFIYGSDGSAYVNVYGKRVHQGKSRLKIIYQKENLTFENLDTGEGPDSALGFTRKHTEYTMTDNLYLFAQNYKGSPRFNGTKGHERCVGRFSYYDKHGDLICDLYPCYRNSDGVIGMYDKARGLFLTNVGTGSFTKGADV